MSSVLVVEDNAELMYGLKLNLEVEGYVALTADTGLAALECLRRKSVNLVLLDLMLPDVSGFDVLTTVSSELPRLPVVVLSACADEKSRVAAFRLGAHDYVTKPFSVLELMERIKVRLKTDAAGANFPAVLNIDETRRELTVSGQTIRVTPKEFDLLCALLRAEGAVLSRGDLLEIVWNAPRDLNTRTVDYHLTSLKKKLKAAGLKNVIRTVHGCGVAWRGT